MASLESGEEARARVTNAEFEVSRDDIVTCLGEADKPDTQASRKITNEIVVIGAGGHSKVVVEAALSSGLAPVAVFDDDSSTWNTVVCGVPVKPGGVDAARKFAKNRQCVIAVGSNVQRKSIFLRLKGLSWSPVIHARACVSPLAKVGVGAFIGANAVVQAGATIEAHAIVNTSASVDHDSRVGVFAHVGPGTHLPAHVTVGDGALLGTGCCARPGVKIGPWATVGAGAAVVSDILPNVVAAGVPARPMRSNT
jgi:sugar O-acyltransferase (sialic acid O-acetyltransferase NeuD family)